MFTLPSPQFENSIVNAMRDFHVPGLSLAVVKDDRVLFVRGFGVRTLGDSTPVNEHTTFAIASISKSFTSTALAMLVSEGRMNWDDPVTRYLPGFRLFDDFASREMRVRDLLIHNSGLHEVSGGTIWYGSDFSREEVVYRLRYLRPTSSFRSSYAYQNVMYLAAGQVLRSITGMEWDEFIQTRIFDPLGMADSAPNLDRARARPNMATPYSQVPYASNGSICAIPYRNHDNVGPAASIHASAWDLAQYLRLHLNNGVFENQVLFSPQAGNELHASQIVIPADPSPALGLKAAPRFTTYGLGWRIQDYHGRKLVQHAGGVDGMRTLVTMLPEERLGVVALSNMEVPLTYPVTFTLLDSLLGEPEIKWVDGYSQMMAETRQKRAAAEEERAAARQPAAKPLLPLEAYAGQYTSALVDAVNVTLESGRLVLRFQHTPAFTADLDPWHYNTFRLTWRDPYIPWGWVTFDQDARGRVERMKFDQPNLLDVDFRELGELPKIG
jgi:CubicO group peptidase (beta-lactamase class C family)